MLRMWTPSLPLLSFLAATFLLWVAKSLNPKVSPFTPLYRGRLKSSMPVAELKVKVGKDDPRY